MCFKCEEDETKTMDHILMHSCSLGGSNDRLIQSVIPLWSSDLTLAWSIHMASAKA